MGAEEFHVVLFPFMAHGHMIPILNIARLFAARDNVKATIITTPLNITNFTKDNESNMKSSAPIVNIEVFRFPAQEVGLPEGFENLEKVMKPEFLNKFFKAAGMLNEQLEQYLEKIRPNCLVADMFFPWATESAAKFNIPRLVFHGTSNFALCAQEIVRLYKPFKNVTSDEEPFVLPSLPHDIQMRRLQIPEDLWKYDGTEFEKRMDSLKDSEIKSYGVLVNSFYELEPNYAEFYKKELGKEEIEYKPYFIKQQKHRE